RNAGAGAAGDDRHALGLRQPHDRLHFGGAARQRHQIRHAPIEAVVVLVHDHVLGSAEDGVRTESIAQPSREPVLDAAHARAGARTYGAIASTAAWTCCSVFHTWGDNLTLPARTAPLMPRWASSSRTASASWTGT